MDNVYSSPLIEITYEMLVRYAGASGDFNPIHTVETKAVDAGLPDVIVHGMLIMGITSKFIRSWFPNKKFLNFNVRFVEMTLRGEKIKIVGKIQAQNDQERIKVDVVVINEKGDKKMKGYCELKY